MTSLAGRSRSLVNFSMFSGSSAATRSGPTGIPISVEVSTSAASWARPCPSWLPNARPPIWPSMASIGPAALRISSGIASTQAPDTRCATGSHSRFQVGRLASTHSLADHGLGLGGAGRELGGGSSHSSASLTASLTAARCAPVSDDVVAASCWRASCAGQVVVDRAVARALRLAEHLPELGEHLPELADVEAARPARSRHARHPGKPNPPMPNGSCGPSPGRRSGLRSSSRSRSRSAGPNPNGMSLMGPTVRVRPLPLVVGYAAGRTSRRGSDPART